MKRGRQLVAQSVWRALVVIELFLGDSDEQYF
jgi:hypothetical protein